MSKLLKKILIVTSIITIVIVAALVLSFAALSMKLKSEIAHFTPLETGKVVDDIFVVKDDFANLFIVQDGVQYVVFDGANNPSSVAKEMEKLGIDLDAVAAVFLTHTDGDHVGAIGLFEKAKLYISKEEEPMINGTKFRKFVFCNSLPRTDYILLENHQTVQIGNLKIEGILVPGHTPGAMAYLINDKYLFTGDIVSLKDGKIAPAPEFFNMNHAQAIKSLDDIFRNISNAEYIFTAHWGYTDDFKAAVNND